MSTVETLREAARLMRERAEPAQDYIERDCEPYTPEALRQEGLVKEDAEHFASWQPVVALAVADWLDEHVEVHSTYDCQYEPCAALATANAYLRSES